MRRIIARRSAMRGMNWKGQCLSAVLAFAAIYCLASQVADLHSITSTIVAQAFNLQARTTDFLNPSHLRHKKIGKVAICLVGGLRAFELTGPSIRTHLLDVYPEADVFVNAPVDGDVHKITVVSGVQGLKSIRLFRQESMNTTDIPKDLLTSFGSPHGIQGLLQYFAMVEGCLGLIESYESLHSFKYDWVIRTRMDGFWNGPMPSLQVFNESKYHVPAGSGYGGYNDRLGVGNRQTSRIGMSRLSLLREIHELGLKKLNSERAFKAQFDARNVAVERHEFNFCVLSFRKYAKDSTVPVASILGRSALSGLKCRPCMPNSFKKLKLEAVGEIVETSFEHHPLLCDAHKGWERQWGEIYDLAVGPEMAEIRKTIASRPIDQCVRDMYGLMASTEVWNAPSVENLCKSAKFITYAG